MLNMIKNFKNDESGAVTVDWVVLTAAVVGLGLLVIQQITPAITEATGTISTSITGNTSGGGDTGNDG